MNNITVGDLMFEPFITYEQIQERTRLLGKEISTDYRDKNPVFIGVLNGCFMFMSDLMKEIDLACEMSFVKLASYQGTAQGQINQLLGIGMDLTGRDVIIVEDIVDTGNSLKHTLAALDSLNIGSVSVCSLLMKPTCLVHTFDNIKYVGFEIAPEFVVGYGLDYNSQGRNLRHIYKVCSE